MLDVWTQEFDLKAKASGCCVSIPVVLNIHVLKAVYSWMGTVQSTGNMGKKKKRKKVNTQVWVKYIQSGAQGPFMAHRGFYLVENLNIYFSDS